MQALVQIQQAVKQARERTRDASIGVRVSKGLFQVVRVTYDKRGTSSVVPVSAPVSAQGVERFLANL